MDFTYKGKPILPTKTALNELSEINVNLYEVPEMSKTTIENHLNISLIANYSSGF